MALRIYAGRIQRATLVRMEGHPSMARAARALVRLRIIYPRDVRRLRQRERWLRRWRRAKLLYLERTPFQAVRDTDPPRNIYGEEIDRTDLPQLEPDAPPYA